MTKPVIVTRAGKGVALTYEEQDANFTNLQNATLTVTNGTTSHAFNLNDTLTFTAGSNITIGVNATTGAITIASTGGSPLTSDLNVNGHKIVSSSNGDVWVKPNGTGNILLDVTSGGEVDVLGSVRFNNASLITDTSGSLYLDSSVGDLIISADGVSLINNTSANPALTVQNSTTGSPSNSTTPGAWLKVKVGGTTRYIALYS